jgi:uncharacterized protein YpmS
MKFNLESILDRFENKNKFLVLLVLVTAIVIIAVGYPVSKAYFESEARNCNRCLDENHKLTERLLRLNVLFTEYVATQTENELNERAYSTEASFEDYQHTSHEVEQAETVALPKKTQRESRLKKEILKTLNFD